MGYYSEKLAGRRLQECYEIAPDRIKRYLEAEVRFAAGLVEARASVLELGCGYGRVAVELAKVAGRVVGIDTSVESLELARVLTGTDVLCEFLEMDATDLRFPDDEFDAVVCVQNGICAFGVDRERLVGEALRVTRPGGRAVFSSYSERFWPHRLEWFELQAKRGLVGEIDYDATGDGVVVCKDGFRAGALGPSGFRRLCAAVGVRPDISEVDESSVFCVIEKKVTG